jgi:uncharacterized RDD family membrane protein YckC
MRHLNYRPASNFKRCIAYLIDVIPIQFGLYFISQACYGVSPFADPLASPQNVAASFKARMLIEVGTLVIWLLYSIVGELSPWRGTFGKKMMGISVRSIRGGKMTFGQVMARNGSKILSAIPCYLGFFFAFFVYGNRAWHDSLSGTAVTDRK